MKKLFLILTSFLMTLCATAETKSRPFEYAVAPLDGVPGIESASPVPFDGYINVMLTDNAVSGMSIRLVPVINTINPIEQSIVEGNNNFIVNTSSLPVGQYVLCLIHNNIVIQSLNIYKIN